MIRALRHVLRLAVVLALLVPPAARADGRSGAPAGAFDYYILALSWSPAWCAEEPARRQAEQCAPGGRRGFIVHGLWPQFESGGWPEFCRTRARDPSRAETRAMAELMGSPGLAWYQWKKHGRCTGLDPADYFALIRRAAERIRIPDILLRLRTLSRLHPRVVDAAFIEANPELEPDGVTVTCRDGVIREVRICLTRALEPRRCTGEAARDCPLRAPLFVPAR